MNMYQVLSIVSIIITALASTSVFWLHEHKVIKVGTIVLAVISCITSVFLVMGYNGVITAFMFMHKSAPREFLVYLVGAIATWHISAGIVLYSMFSNGSK